MPPSPLLRVGKATGTQRVPTLDLRGLVPITRPLEAAIDPALCRTCTPRPRTRKAPWRSVSGEVVVTHAAGEQATAELRDVSTHGCNVLCEAAWLRGGIFVSIRLGDEAPLQAIIRWARSGRCGVEFLRPITPDREQWMDMVEGDDSW